MALYCIRDRTFSRPPRHAATAKQKQTTEGGQMVSTQRRRQRQRARRRRKPISSDRTGLSVNNECGAVRLPPIQQHSKHSVGSATKPSFFWVNCGAALAQTVQINGKHRICTRDSLCLHHTSTPFALSSVYRPPFSQLRTDRPPTEFKTMFICLYFMFIK